MNKRRRLIRIIVVSLLSIGVALTVIFVGRGAPRDAQLETAIVSRADLMITAPVRGNLEIANKSYLSFGVTGTVKEVLVDRGDTVEKDQVLARLDARSLELGVETAELQVGMAQRQVKIARAQYEIALINLEEPAAPPLGESEEVLEQRVDMARASWETAKLNLEVSEISLEMAELNLERAVILAPFDGVVADISISEGQEISAAALAAPAISLIGLDQIEMRGFVDELDILVVKVGQNVTIVVDALRDLEIKGTVAFVSPMGTAQLGVVSYEAFITLDEPHEVLKDGMSATADIIIERRDNVLLVPNRAIRGTRERPVVMLLDIDGQVEEREIMLGLTDGVNSEVHSGLEEGDRVVLPARETGSGNILPFGGH